jgi:hypothetical protein
LQVQCVIVCACSGGGGGRGDDNSAADDADHDCRTDDHPGATTGRCSFPTESLSNGSQYSLQFYSDSKPLRNPSAVVAIGGRADACGVCGGSNATCTGCDGVPNSGKKIDSCGVCGGSCDDPFAISFVNPQSDYQRSYL